MAQRIYWLWLSLKSEISTILASELLARFGTPEHVYTMNREELIADTRLSKKQVDALCDKSLKAAEAVEYDCERLQVAMLTLADSAYPDRLRQIADPPLVLYVRGTLPNLDRAPGVAIVGTRGCTSYGIAAAERFAGGLAAAGFTVVSGMARGVDTAAARGALRAGGQTIAVLAGGVNICYPPENNFLMGDILLSGAVISENPPGTTSDGWRFPVRNRIISGLSAAALIVEAPERSGALITARLALEQGRDVFAVPGSIDAPMSVGCNRLIRHGEAMLVTQPSDILEELRGLLRDTPDEKRVRAVFERETGEAGRAPESPVSLWDKILSREKAKKTDAPGVASEVTTKQTDEGGPKTLPEGLNEEETMVARAVLDGAATPDEIIEVTALAASRVMTTLTLLELDGVLGRENGRIILL